MTAKRSLGVLAIFISVPVHAAQLYNVTEIPLPAGAVRLVPSSISGTGQVVGSIEFPTVTRPFSFSGGIVTTLTSPAGHLASAASGVNDAGQIIGWMTDDRGIPKSAVWNSATDASPTVLESSGGSDANVYATAINNTGSIGGYFTGSGSGNTASWRAVRWTFDGRNWQQDVLPRALANPPPGVFHAGYSINDAGVVVGTGSAANVTLLSGQAAVRWDGTTTATGLAILAEPFSFPRYQANAINNSGAIVGQVVDATGSSRGVAWSTSGAASDLGIVPGFNQSVATDVNTGGTIVGAIVSVAGASHAAVIEDAHWSRLASRLSTLEGWAIDQAVALNDSGIIVGTATRAGVSRGVMLAPSVFAIDGDANIDGVVNFDDLLVVAQNYGLSSGANWRTGDFSGEGAVTFDDLLAVAQHYSAGALSVDQAQNVGTEVDSAFAVALSMVPEPGLFIFAAAAGPVLSRRRPELR